MSVHEIWVTIVEQARSQTGIEILAFAFGIWCVWQTVCENPWCWITGTIQVVLQGYLFFGAGLYSDFSLQIIFFVLNFYGLYEWMYGGEKKSPLKITTTSLRGHLLIVGVILPALTVGLACMNTRIAALMHVELDPKTYWMDANTTALSIVAQVMLARKKIENWWVWIIANVIYIGLYGYKGLYYLAAMQIIFIALSIRGWIDWRATLLKQNEISAADCPSAA